MREVPRPPTGTVTCLFSDIEGSTKLELALGTGPYRDVLERHRMILREAFRAHDGHEQSTEGDSFFVLFRRAVDGVSAAVDGQRAIAAEPWPDGAEIRVRMGLHTGRGTEHAGGRRLPDAGRVGAARAHRDGLAVPSRAVGRPA